MIKKIDAVRVYSKKKLAPKIKRTPQLGEIIKALDEEDDVFFVKLFESGYNPRKAPAFIGLIVDINKMSEKYDLWQMGILI